MGTRKYGKRVKVLNEADADSESGDVDLLSEADEDPRIFAFEEECKVPRVHF